MRVQRPGGSVAVQVTGEGPLVVCAPGMADLAISYRRLAPALVDAGYRVAVIDLRGHGDSDDSFPTVDPASVGADLLAVVDALGGGPAVLVGNSAAGASAVWAAAEAPERVAGLVLLGPVVREQPGFPGWAKTLTRWLFAGPWGAWLWTVAHRSLFKGGLPDDHATHAAALRASLGRPGRMRSGLENGLASKDPCAARVGEVRAPTLVVMGSADPDFADARAEAAWLGEALHAEALVLDGVGHYPHLERPDATAGAVRAFLGRIAWRAA
jgi:pimeloyl-ACP methyl ester carboxylesterase